MTSDEEAQLKRTTGFTALMAFAIIGVTIYVVLKKGIVSK